MEFLETFFAQANMFVVVALFIVGLIFIIKGGDWFVDSASWIAEVLGVPKFVIGATIVSLATTLPEMIVSVVAAADGKVDMAAGNAVGSVTANTAMIVIIIFPSLCGFSILAMDVVIVKKISGTIVTNNRFKNISPKGCNIVAFSWNITPMNAPTIIATKRIIVVL